MIYPVLTACVTAIFAWGVWQDFSKRKRPYQALWFTSLFVSAVASVSYALAVQFQSPLAFKMYYLGGALLAGAYMGMGSLYLVLSAPWARRVLTILVILSVVSTVLVLTASVDPLALEALAGTSGRGVLQPGMWQPMVVLHNVFGALAVVGVGFYSVIRGIRRKDAPGFMWGNFLIALGILIVSMAGSAAKWMPDWDGSFWTAMALGWFVAFVGFRVVTAAIAQRAQSRGVSTKQPRSA